MSTNTLVILCTCPSQELAEDLASRLVEEKLAACANIVPTLRSIYLWKGKVHNDSESLLIIKSDQSRYDALEKRITEIHPYEVPEILGLPVAHGLPAYLQWMSGSDAG